MYYWINRKRFYLKQLLLWDYNTENLTKRNLVACTCGTTTSPPGLQSAPVAGYIQNRLSHRQLLQSQGVESHWKIHAIPQRNNHTIVYTMFTWVYYWRAEYLILNTGWNKITKTFESICSYLRAYLANFSSSQAVFPPPKFLLAVFSKPLKQEKKNEIMEIKLILILAEIIVTNSDCALNTLFDD